MPSGGRVQFGVKLDASTVPSVDIRLAAMATEIRDKGIGPLESCLAMAGRVFLLCLLDAMEKV